jgi:hypothetical protein
VPSDEGRYLVLGYPFLVITCAYLVVELLKGKRFLAVLPLLAIVAWLAFNAMKHAIKW